MFSGATDHIAGVGNATQSEAQPLIVGTRVGRPWRQRLQILLAEGAIAARPFSTPGRNVGILAYELSKLGSSFIHAIDGSQPELEAARVILRSVEIPTRVDLVDLADDASTILDPGYDIVQLLAVYQHVQRGRGDAAARRMLATLAEHPKETSIQPGATYPHDLPAIISTLVASGFRLQRETQSPARRVKHLVFRRS